MCMPSSGRADQRPALIAWASSIRRRRSARSRSAMSMKSWPCRPFTEAIMIADGPLEARFDQVAGDDRRDGQVAHRVKLREAGAQPGVIAQPDHEIPAGGRVQAEMRRLEVERGVSLEADRQPVR